MASATITSKGQITIPVRVREALGLDAGDRIEFVEIDKGKFAIVPGTRSIRELEGMFQDRRRKPVSIEMNAAITRQAAKSR
jgi:AbrB family looped-hinge helix DNA binding protein